jgi:hypothetical protein
MEPRKVPGLFETCRQYGLVVRKPKIDSDLQRDLEHGWLIPYLIKLDDLLWGRWEYWCEAMLLGRLPDRPIPQIEFSTPNASLGEAPGHKHLQYCLDLVMNQRDSWQSWGNWIAFDYLMDWLLYGFGHRDQPELPREPSSGASMRLYQGFDLGMLMAYPYDYWGDLLAINRHGQSRGFYPTPHEVVKLMVEMAMIEKPDQEVNDCALGTGRMLLHASNYSVRLSGNDVDLTVLKAALINGYCYAPWLVRPFPFFHEQNNTDQQQPQFTKEQESVLLNAPTAQPLWLQAKSGVINAVSEIVKASS